MLLTIIAKCVLFEVGLTVAFFIGDYILRALWRGIEKGPELDS